MLECTIKVWLRQKTEKYLLFLNKINNLASVPDGGTSGSMHAAPSLDPRDPGEYRRPSLVLVYRRRRTEA